MNSIIQLIEEKAVAYEQGKMMRSDSEVEIDILDDEVWISDYSEERGGAEGIEKICPSCKVVESELIALCAKHNWCYSL